MRQQCTDAGPPAGVDHQIPFGDVSLGRRSPVLQPRRHGGGVEAEVLGDLLDRPAPAYRAFTFMYSTWVIICFGFLQLVGCLPAPTSWRGHDPDRWLPGQEERDLSYDREFSER